MSKVSVVIPMYNSEKTIEQVLGSVISQTAISEIAEIIVVDDGSTDSSALLVEEFIRTHPTSSILLIRQPNGGVSSARNHGIRIAKGEYIALLDSDDLWMPQKIERQLQILNNNPEIVFLGSAYYLGLKKQAVKLTLPWRKNLNLEIPARKVTAIVGASGSGKTTLIKLILGFYAPNKGKIKIGEIPLENINPHLWRSHTGSVMQDGFIFSESIAQNIAIGEEQIDIEKLRHAVTVANIRDFIDSLPLGYNTKIGMEGNGISQGQRQRILIARAVYKNPEFLFFDEATNALDANNEKEIMEHLHGFYKGKTVVVVAHRLSTVRDADKIVVLDKGQVTEEGTHQELIAKQGLYYQLVKNQLAQ